jgi:hypothetical protein
MRPVAVAVGRAWQSPCRQAVPGVDGGRNPAAQVVGYLPDIIYVLHDDLRLDPELVKALASEKRLLILEWLRDPQAHFPPQRDKARIAGVKEMLSGDW